MGLPTGGNDIEITSNTFLLKGGRTASVRIRLADKTSSFDSSYSMKVSDIGSYEVDFDTYEDADSIEEFYVNVPTYKFKFWGELSGGELFGSMLAELTFQDLVEIQFTYDNSTDYFLCQASDFNYDRVKREFSCKAFSPFKYGSIYNSTLITAYDPDSASVSVNLENGDPYTFITYRDTIRKVLETQGVSDVRIQSEYLQTAEDINRSAIQGGEDKDVFGYVLQSNGNFGFENNGKFVVDNYKNGRARIIEGAIAEGAMVGNLFGEAFYVRRDYDGLSDPLYYSNISPSDLDEFDLEFFLSPIKTISVAINSTPSAVATETILENNPQSIDVQIPEYGIDANISAVITGGVLNIVEVTDGGEVLYQEIVDSAVQSYKKSLGAVDSIKFSGVINDCKKVLPYEWMLLDTDIDPMVTTSNQKVRMTSAKYNFKENNIEFEAYSI